MSNENLILAVDLETSGMKVALITVRGRVLGWEYEPVHLILTPRAGLYSLSLHSTREDIIRAFLEGIALNTRWLLSPVEKFLRRNVRGIHIVGGGAQSDVWCQILRMY